MNVSIEKLIDVVLAILVVISPIITFLRTSSIKKTLEELDMIVKYKKGLTTTEKYSQTFSNLVDDWQYSEKEDAPILVGKKDMQAFIQSFADTALDKVLEKFLNGDVTVPVKTLLNKVESFDEVVDQVDKVVNEYDYSKDMLTAYAELLDKAEFYRKKYNLSPELNAQDVFKKVEEMAREKSKKFSELINKEKNNNNEEVREKSKKSFDLINKEKNNNNEEVKTDEKES